MSKETIASDLLEVQNRRRAESAPSEKPPAGERSVRSTPEAPVVVEDLDSRYRRILALQLEMNRETWRMLQSHGVNQQTDLRLDFSYVAPDESSANKLRGVIEDQTDYEVRVRSDGAVFRRKWSVVGSTQPTKVSPEILDQWVDWMVTAGLHQGCEFDGWGTEVPN